MRKKYIFGKKLYISILTTILILLTTVATTFAWIGVFANSTFDTFDINIINSEFSEDYNIVVSSTGLPGTFKDTIDPYDIKRQILVNWGYDESLFLKYDSENNRYYNNKEKIDIYFQLLNLDQATNLPTVSGSGMLTNLGKFYDVYGDETAKYFKFDIYVSVEEINSSSSSDFYLDVYLGTDLLTGNTKGKNVINPIQYPSSFVNPYDTLIENGSMALANGYRTVKANETINYAKVNSEYASRIAFEKYEVVDKGNVDSYINKTPKSTIIYTGDKYDYPVCLNDFEHIYNFGGILPNEINFATLNYNSSEWQFIQRQYWVMDLPQDIYDVRGVESQTRDKILNKETNHLIDSLNADEQIGINQMMKVTCYFWFEGWDADCWNAINLSPVTINIDLRMKNED